MTTNIERCCTLIDIKMTKLLKNYHNTNVKIIKKIFKYVNNLSNRFNIPVNKILNYNAYEWYYSNFLNALLCYMFVPWTYTILDNKKLSHVQIHELIFHIYKLVINKQCNLYIIDYYEQTFINSLNGYAIRNDVCNYAKKYIHLLKIIFKHGSNLVNKQQKIIKFKLNILRLKKRIAKRIISNWIAEKILWNPNHIKSQKRIEELSKHFYSLTIE
jgi:hypothetical protein